MKSYIAIGVICFISGGFSIGFITHKNVSKPQIKIVKETKTKTEYIRIPTTIIEYEKAYNSPFEIKETIDGKWMHINVSDGFKSGYKAVKLESIDVRKNIIQSGYSIFVADNKLYTAFDISYLRAWNHFAFGGGLILNAWNQNKVYGIRVVGQLQF